MPSCRAYGSHLLLTESDRDLYLGNPKGEALVRADRDA